MGQGSPEPFPFFVSAARGRAHEPNFSQAYTNQNFQLKHQLVSADFGFPELTLVRLPQQSAAGRTPVSLG